MLPVLSAKNIILLIIWKRKSAWQWFTSQQLNWFELGTRVTLFFNDGKTLSDASRSGRSRKESQTLTDAADRGESFEQLPQPGWPMTLNTLWSSQRVTKFPWHFFRLLHEQSRWIKLREWNIAKKNSSKYLLFILIYMVILFLKN